MKSSAEKSSSTTPSTATQAKSQSFFPKVGGGEFLEPAVQAKTLGVQTKMKVNAPGDAHEQEADKMADKVMRMPDPSAEKKEEKVQRQADGNRIGKKEENIQKAPAPEEKIQKKEEEKIQKKGRIQRTGEGTPAVTSDTQSAIQNKTGGGQPLSSEVRDYMEPRFGADFSQVRTHNDPASAALNNQLSARAFTYQNHIFFSKDQYQPGTGEGKQLLAHELTHTIQQGHAVQRSPKLSTTAALPAIQRFGKEDVLDYLAEEAYHLPGFHLVSILIGFNPINMKTEVATAANYLRAMIEIAPGGNFITKAMDQYGMIDKAGTWVKQQLITLGISGKSIRADFKKFYDSLGFSDVFSPLDVLNRAINIFKKPINKIINFIEVIKTGLMKMVRESVLKPIAKMAQGTPGYDLLRAILGQDPISGEEVPRNAETLIGGFMKLIGRQDVWENIKKGNAVQSAWKWFQNALIELKNMVAAIPQKIVATFSSLSWEEVVSVVGIYAKVGNSFLTIATDFVKWGANQVLGLLEIIFSVVAPAVMPYLQQTKGAFNKILEDPIGFVKNLISSVANGVNMFVSNIAEHLVGGLVTWLTGAMQGAGLVLPEKWDLKGIFSLFQQIIGLTYQKIRQKAVDIIGEEKVVFVEEKVSFIKTLITEGPIALWEEIKEEIGEMGDMALGEIQSWAIVQIAQKGAIKLASMFVPGGAFVQAILAIYDVIKFFIEKGKQIMEFAKSVFDSIVKVAYVKLPDAVKWINDALVKSLPLFLGFLADFLSLGKISDKVIEVFKKIQKPVDKVITKVVEWLKKQWGALVQGVKSGVAGIKETVSAWLGIKEEFKARDGSTHNLFAEQVGDDVVLMIASTKMTYAKFIENIIKHKNYNKEDYTDAINIAKGIDKMISSKERMKGGAKTGRVNFSESKGFKAELVKLAALTAIFMKSENGELPVSSTPKYDPLKNSFGKSVHVEQLTKFGPPGTQPVAKNLSWNILSDRLTESGGTTYYVRGHLLNHNLYGPGTKWENLTPLTRNANKKHFEEVEKEVKELVNKGNILEYTVTAMYTRTTDTNLQNKIKNYKKFSDDKKTVLSRIVTEESKIPKKLNAKWSYIDPKSGVKKSGNKDIDNNIDDNLSGYVVRIR